MKATQRLLSLTAAVVLLFSLVSCAALAPKANFTQKITAGNIELTIRDDMKEDPSIKSDTYITCYFWNGYGMNIASIKSSDAKWDGETADTVLMDTLKDQKNLTELKKLDDFSYAEYNINNSGKDYLFTAFILEEGYEFYFIEFYTMSKSSAKYLDQYKTILSSIKMVQEPEKTAEVTIDGVKVTLDGDAYDYGNDFYLCGRYLVNAFSYSVAGFNIDSKGYCQSLIEQNNYKDAQGSPVTEIITTDDGISYFESLDDDSDYLYYFIKIVDNKAIGVLFITTSPADDQLKADFIDIVSGAVLA